MKKRLTLASLQKKMMTREEMIERRINWILGIVVAIFILTLVLSMSVFSPLTGLGTSGGSDDGGGGGFGGQGGPGGSQGAGGSVNVEGVSSASGGGGLTSGERASLVASTQTSSAQEDSAEVASVITENENIIAVEQETSTNGESKIVVEKVIIRQGTDTIDLIYGYYDSVEALEVISKNLKEAKAQIEVIESELEKDSDNEYIQELYSISQDSINQIIRIQNIISASIPAFTEELNKREEIREKSFIMRQDLSHSSFSANTEEVIAGEIQTKYSTQEKVKATPQERMVEWNLEIKVPRIGFSDSFELKYPSEFIEVASGSGDIEIDEPNAFQKTFNIAENKIIRINNAKQTNYLIRFTTPAPVVTEMSTIGSGEAPELRIVIESDIEYSEVYAEIPYNSLPEEARLSPFDYLVRTTDEVGGEVNSKAVNSNPDANDPFDGAFIQIGPFHTSTRLFNINYQGYQIPPECGDFGDNDDDGYNNFPADPGCSSSADITENNEPTEYQCSDGMDNDSDELADGNDPQCNQESRGWVYSSEATQCSNGVDDDGDGLIDSVDPGCSDEEDNEALATTQCQDGIDNDGDGWIDFPEDAGCNSKLDNSEKGFGESDTRDTDRDNVPDHLDNCPTVSNPNQQDSDANGVGDACQSQERRRDPPQDESAGRGSGGGGVFSSNDGRAEYEVEGDFSRGSFVRVDIKENDAIKFVFEEIDYTINIKTIEKDFVFAEIVPNLGKQTFILNIPVVLNINADDKNDFIVNVEEIIETSQEQRAFITLAAITEDSSNAISSSSDEEYDTFVYDAYESTVSSGNELSLSAEVIARNYNKLVGFIIAAIVIIATIIVINIKRRRDFSY